MREPQPYSRYGKFSITDTLWTDTEKGEARDLTQHDLPEERGGFCEPLPLNEFDMNVVRTLEKRSFDLR